MPKGQILLTYSFILHVKRYAKRVFDESDEYITIQRRATTDKEHAGRRFSMHISYFFVYFFLGFLTYSRIT